MIWIKLGILLVGFSYAGLLPYEIKKTLQHIQFDPRKETLSYLSNANLYDKKYAKAYKYLLFATAILTYVFFWLLAEFYDLGENEIFMKQIDYTFACLTLLAFIPHNINPYSFFRKFGASLQRLIHNILGFVVFLVLPALVIMFQIAILPEFRLLGISGLIIMGVVVIISFRSLIINGITGVTEILFINGISIWSIFVTIITLIR